MDRIFPSSWDLRSFGGWVEDKCDGGPCVLIGGNHDQTLQDLPQNEVKNN